MNRVNFFQNLFVILMGRRARFRWVPWRPVQEQTLIELLSGSHSIGQNLNYLEWCPKHICNMFLGKKNKKLNPDRWSPAIYRGKRSSSRWQKKNSLPSMPCIIESTVSKTTIKKHVCCHMIREFLITHMSKNGANTFQEKAQSRHRTIFSH